ncbi:hypothetical protein EVAR_50945_1 [Eumeta japonica]|uniref:Uncharacterized protein n=1 Tax=Eumeta variegata TaxID=151549 RepID=A0A4C1X9U5_EUMVA|nr:hypothetical protein EVAR_50945_1 [Eumeta japonica]
MRGRRAHGGLILGHAKDESIFGPQGTRSGLEKDTARVQVSAKQPRVTWCDAMLTKFQFGVGHSNRLAVHSLESALAPGSCP